MESPNLNPTPNDESALESQLKAHFSVPPLADDGFSQRVLAALPVPERKTSPLSRRHFCLGGFIAGLSIATAGLLNSGNVESALAPLDHALTLALGQLCTAPVTLALGFALLSVGFAYRRQWRLLPRL